jgi:hypothetical protein
MTGGVFLLSGEDLVAMHEQPYDSEDLLQTLLAKYPELIAGESAGAPSPRRWLLVKREVGIPDSATGGSRWSLDHLFIDEQAVPTLVEVKRSDDTRIRREVVGQMLDYAANGICTGQPSDSDPISRLAAPKTDSTHWMSSDQVWEMTSTPSDSGTTSNRTFALAASGSCSFRTAFRRSFGA